MLVVIAIRFPKGSCSLEMVDLGRSSKEWDIVSTRKVVQGREPHEDNFEAGVSTSTWGDRCAGK